MPKSSIAELTPISRNIESTRCVVLLSRTAAVSVSSISSRDAANARPMLIWHTTGMPQDPGQWVAITQVDIAGPVTLLDPATHMGDLPAITRSVIGPCSYVLTLGAHPLTIGPLLTICRRYVK